MIPLREKVGQQLDLEDEARALGSDRYRTRRPLPWQAWTDGWRCSDDALIYPLNEPVWIWRPDTGTLDVSRNELKLVDRIQGGRWPSKAS